MFKPKKMEIKPKLAEEIAGLYNELFEKLQETSEIDENLENLLKQKIIATGRKELISEFNKTFDDYDNAKSSGDWCLASKKKVTKKTKETNRDFELSVSDFGRFLSRFLPPITLKYSKKTIKETVTEEIIEDDVTDCKNPAPYGWK